MTDMRERLIELIRQEQSCSSEDIADHLIENGVILPPCKVGDTVYIVSVGKIEPHRIGKVNLEYIVDNGTGWKDIWYFKDYNIGDTIFLTREEAERALKERGSDHA